jgi:hypothetical protein
MHEAIVQLLAPVGRLAVILSEGLQLLHILSQ